MPTTQFGFLLQDTIYTVELPDTIDRKYSLTSSAGLTSDSPLSIQCARASSTDFSQFGWRKSFQAAAAGTAVDVYVSQSDPAAAMPVWQSGDWNLWLQLRGDMSGNRSQILSNFLNGIVVESSRRPFPRVTLRGGLVPGNPYIQPINREQVLFNVVGTTQTLALRYDGALGTEGVSIDGGFALASASNSLGVSALLSGAAADRDVLLQQARTVADSVTVVQQ